MYQKRLESIIKIIEMASVCGFFFRQFSPKTCAELLNLEKYPTPEYQLMNQKLDEFKKFIHELPPQIKRELVVMNVIGLGDFSLEQWDEAMEWCKTIEWYETDVKEPEYFLFRSGFVLPTNLTRFLFDSLLNADGFSILKSKLSDDDSERIF